MLINYNGIDNYKFLNYRLQEIPAEEFHNFRKP